MVEVSVALAACFIEGIFDDDDSSLLDADNKQIFSCWYEFKGVIHRDLKPENLVLEKSDSSMHVQSSKDDWMSNDAFWDDKAVSHLEECKAWKIILVDFGFAKALTPDECMQKGSSGLNKKTQSIRNLVHPSNQKDIIDSAAAA